MDALVDFIGLTDLALRRRTEVAHGLFVAEGVQTVGRALTAGYRPRVLAVSGVRTGRADVVEIVDRFVRAGGQVHVDGSGDLDRVAGFDVHRGVLGSFERRPLPDVAALTAAARTLVVLEAVVDHTNVGSVVRSAVALGADGVVLDPRCADPLYRRAVRTSMGAVFAVPHARCATWPGGLHELRAAGYRVLALTPGAGAVDLDALDVAADDKVAVLLGSEAPGLSRAALAEADARVAVPMRHGVDSLNVAACAAVAFWALATARRSGGASSG